MSTRLGLALLIASAAPLFPIDAFAQTAPEPPPTTEPAPPAKAQEAAPTPAAPDTPATAEPAPVQPARPAEPSASPAAKTDPNQRAAFEFATLRILRDKGIITEAEYQSAMRDLGEPLGARAADANTFVMGKWATTLYGLAQGDFMYNSTQSANDFISNAQIARPGTFNGEHGRTTFTARDSRIGIRVKAPAPDGYSFSANVEGDFIGSQPGIYQNTGGTAPVAGTTNSEAGYFGNSPFRIRIAAFKVETPAVDFTVGQFWNILGWQPTYIPTIVTFPGLVGELYGRSVQARVSKTIKLDPITIDVAIGAMRPSQRDSTLPDGEAGIRFAFNKWTAPHTIYMTSTSIQPASIAVTGDLRQYRAPEFVADPLTTNNKGGGAIAIDGFIPIIPGTKDNKDNALAITGEFVAGEGVTDQYTTFATGINNPALPKPAPTAANPNPASPAYPSHLDSNLAAYDAGGALHLIRTRTWFLAGEYYVPGTDGRLGLFGGYYSSEVVNPGDFTSAPSAVRKHEVMVNGGAFVDVTKAVRVGADYAHWDDEYADGIVARNWGIQTSGFFFF